MKIGILSSQFMGCPAPRYGGLERVCWDVANGLGKRGHKVVLFAPDNSRVPANGFLFKTGPPQDTVNVDWLRTEQDMVAKASPYFKDLDILWENNWMGSSYFYKVNDPRIKICHTHHGGLNPEIWCKSKPPFKTNMIAISNWMKRVYASQGYDSQVCYNPVDLEEYKFQAEKGDRLLFVGRLDTFKQPDVAIAVAKRLNLGLDIVGGSFVYHNDYFDSIKSQCDGTQIKLHLDASQEDKIRLYQNAKAVLFPSRMGEPFGLIVPESNACGGFVVGLNDGAIGETIQDGVSGFVVGDPSQQVNDKSRDVEAMVAGVKKMDSIKVDPLACRKRAEFFSVDRCVERYEVLFNDIISGREW